MTVEQSIVDRVVVITIATGNPGNAIDGQTGSAVDAALEAFEMSDSLDVAVLTGTSDAFMDGGMLDSTVTSIETALAEPMLGATRSTSSKPVIAAIEGPCLGLGLELALWCDLRICGRSALFGVVSLRHGRPPSKAGIQRLPRLVGQSMALELALTHRKMDSIDSHAAGLVNLVVEDGDALVAAIEIGQQISTLPPSIVRAHRDAIRVADQWPRSDPAPVADHPESHADKSDDREIQVTDGSGEYEPFPIDVPNEPNGSAVVFIPDRLGMDPAATSVVNRYVESGYVVVSVPLNSSGGTSPQTEGADAVVAGSIADRLTAGLVEARRQITAEDDDVSPNRTERVAGGGVVIATGLGLGGGLAVWMSNEDPDVAACITFGAVSGWPNLGPMTSTKTAYLGHVGQAPEATYEMETVLRERGLDATFETYRGVDPEFYRAEGAEARAAFELAWARTEMFLNRVHR